MKELISRRSFLKRGGYLTAGLTAFSLNTLPTKAIAQEIKVDDFAFDEVFDVIVVGSGIAGATAGITAAEKGNKVVIVEKMNVLGGSSLVSGLNFACVESDEQLAKGIKDTPELLAADMRKVSGDYGDPALALELARNTTRFYHFIKDKGVVFETLKDLGGHSVQRSLWASGGGIAIMKPLFTHIRTKLAERCDLRKRVKVDDLVFNKDGRVTGVKVREQYYFNFDDIQNDDNTNTSGVVKYYGARKGVVFASGGYCRDSNMLGSEARLLAQAQSNANPGATAGTLKMLIANGAQAVNLALFRFAYPIPTEDILWGILLNPDCKRFINELNTRNTLGTAILQMKEKYGGKAPVLIYDQVGADNFHDKQRFTLSREGKNGLDATLYMFNTIEELAQKMGYDPATLKKTVDEYNTMLDAGEDKEFGKDVKALKGAAIKKAPFYAMRLHPNVTYTPGGVRIDNLARVLSAKDGKPIVGLYACGEITGGVHGAERLTSTSCPDCGSFGLISGDNVSTMSPLSLTLKKSV